MMKTIWFYSLLTGFSLLYLTAQSQPLVGLDNWYNREIKAGDPWIYNEYIDHDRLTPDFDNRRAAENLTGLLLRYARRQ